MRFSAAVSFARSNATEMLAKREIPQVSCRLQVPEVNTCVTVTYSRAAIGSSTPDSISDGMAAVQLEHVAF